MKDDLFGKIMNKFVGLRKKTYSYLIDDDSEDKKAKSTKNGVIRRKIKFKNYKTCFEATQLENKINHLGKNKIDICNLKKDYKEFIKDNTLLLKIQKRFKSERHNDFTEEINKTVLKWW